MTSGTVYLQNNKGTVLFDFVTEGLFTSENNWSSGVPRELNARTVSQNIQPLTPHETMTEVLSVYGQDQSDDDQTLQAEWEKLMELKEICRKAREQGAFDDYVWFYVKRKGILHRARVHMIDVALPAAATSPLTENGVWHFVVSILRHPYWEMLDSVQLTISPGAGIWHGKTTFPGGGSTMGRVSRLTVDGSLSSSDHSGYYAGFREGEKGDGYMHYWDAKDYHTLVSADTTTQALSGSRSGTAIRITFATTATMADRFFCDLATSATAQSIADDDLEDNRGQYLLLVRYYATDASSSYSFRLKFGSRNSSDTMTPGNVFYVDGEATPGFRLLPVGVINLPWHFGKMDLSAYSSANLFKSLAILLAAERHSGAGYLWIDGFYFVPYTSHLQVFNVPTTGIQTLTEIQTLPDDTVEGVAALSGAGEGIQAPITIITKNWGAPSKAGHFVVVLDDDGGTGSPASMTLDAHATIIRRKLYL